MERMVFLNVGWMRDYQGIEDDTICGGGDFVRKYNEGYDVGGYPPCEVRNFEPYDGDMYGFVKINGSIRVERLGASRGAPSVDGVLVVWVAKSPSNGTVVVGWYRNATVYRNCQPPPESSGRAREDGDEWGYRVKARAEDCTLLPEDRRVLRIPRGRGGMGQSNIWYADQPENQAFRQQVWDFVAASKTAER